MRNISWQIENIKIFDKIIVESFDWTGVVRGHDNLDHRGESDRVFHGALYRSVPARENQQDRKGS